MPYMPLLVLHIGSAAVGLLSGFLAMSFRKGSGLHGAAGNVFFVSMLIATAAGGYLAAFVRPNSGNVMGSTIVEIDTATNTVVQTIKTAPGPNGMTFTPDGDNILFTSPVTVYSATIGAITTAFQITSISFAHQAGAFLDVEAKGFATLTGFDKTPGTYDFSTQGGKNKAVTFSATTTATPTPEPVSMAVLGAGLLSLGLFRRKA